MLLGQLVRNYRNELRLLETSIVVRYVGVVSAHTFHLLRGDRLRTFVWIYRVVAQSIGKALLLRRVRFERNSMGMTHDVCVVTILQLITYGLYCLWWYLLTLTDAPYKSCGGPWIVQNARKSKSQISGSGWKEKVDSTTNWVFDSVRNWLCSVTWSSRFETKLAWFIATTTLDSWRIVWKRWCRWVNFSALEPLTNLGAG